MQACRLTCDIDADSTADAMRVPLGAAISLTPRDEAILVVAVTVAFAPAVARHVTQHFGMSGREFVRGAGQRRRTG